MFSCQTCKKEIEVQEDIYNSTYINNHNCLSCRNEKEEKKAELEDLLYSLELMYEQSKKANDTFPIHSDRFQLIKTALVGYYSK